MARMRSLRGICLVAAMIGTACSDSAELERALPTREGVNFLVVTFDAMRADHLGLYGYERETSPNLDAFAERAVVFESAHNGGQATPTAFASFFTGRYPHRVFRGWRLETDRTLASHLSAAGYRTGAYINNVQVSPKRGFHVGFEVFRLLGGDREGRLVDYARGFLEEPDDRPFFLWIHFISPHAPYKRRDGAEHLYRADYDGPFVDSTGRGVLPRDPQGQERYRNLYDGEIFAVDAVFGDLVQEVEALGLMEDTVIVVSSDHGEELLDRTRFGHASLFEEVWRVPLMIYHPAVSATLRTTVPASNVDLLPTLSAIAGIPPPEDIDGIDLRSPMADQSVKYGVAMTNRRSRAVTVLDGNQKLLMRCRLDAGPETLLFDLERDPQEIVDRASEDRETVVRLLRSVRTLMGGEPCDQIARVVTGKSPTEGLDDETVEELRALGYVD